MVKIDVLRSLTLSDFEKEERRGRFAKAVDILMKHVQENPEDWSAINRMGDLYLKLDNPKAAREQYVKVALSYAADGAYLKAIGVWKKVLRNDPSMLDGHVALGDLYARQGLVAEAKQTLHCIADEYIKRNMKRETGQVLRRMAELDPSDVKVRIRLAEFYAWEGDPEKAAREYAAAIGEEPVKKGPSGGRLT
jgi:tetratricopeptide (TPR) repeat protein